jgi:tetratricopeptide (TPR) repeat protein
LLTDQERWEEASDVYDQAIADSPEQIDLWIAKGWAGYEMGAGFPDTYNVFQHAISLNERRADGYNAVGLLMIREKRYNEADPWFVQAIVRQPNRWSIYLDRARAKRLAGQLDDAMKVLQEAINIFPDQPALFSQMALVYQLLDQTEPAMRAIEKALSLLESPDVGYYLRAGEIYEWAGYADRARQAFEMVLQLQPGNQTAQKALDRLAQPEP